MCVGKEFEVTGRFMV